MLKKIHWDDLPKEQLNPQLERQFFTAGGVTLARFHMKKGLRIPTHHHVSEQVMSVLRGSVKVWVEGEEYLLHEGSVLPIPANTPHSTEVLADTLIVDVFSPPRTDWVAGGDGYLRGVTTAQFGDLVK
jgi:quercetin dioxygenase-like cupin family protein